MSIKTIQNASARIYIYIYIYIYIFRVTQARTVTNYVTDPSYRQGERPATNKIVTVLTTTKIWS
jgi:hypothetical protein